MSTTNLTRNEALLQLSNSITLLEQGKIGSHMDERSKSEWATLLRMEQRGLLQCEDKQPSIDVANMLAAFAAAMQPPMVYRPGCVLPAIEG